VKELDERDLAESDEGGPPRRAPAKAALKRDPKRDLKRDVPTREEIEALDPFPGIHPSRILVAATARQVQEAHDALAARSHVGFDTESRPTFTRGEASEGPHVLQFATLERAYIFQLHVPEARDAVSALLRSTSLTKVGFGLDGDKTQIRSRLGIEPRSVLDLDTVFRDLGFRKSVGLKVAVALVFRRRFAKSKRIGTSNWSHHSLTASQLLYAANDAYAAMRVYAAIAQPAAQG
jgi:ribonuclease D